jgi:DNA-binding XRE family transcriptional regulator
MNNLGSMLDCAANAAHYDLTVFYEMFLSSGIASQMEVGNPRFVTGLSGVELMELVAKKTSDKTLPELNYHPFDRTSEYWAGWALAYYQWHTAYPFAFLQKNGLDIGEVLLLYPTLHEADLSKFVQTADKLIERHLSTKKNTLRTFRKQSHYTQKELAELTGVSLRMIRAYEQGSQDIRKAEAQSVFNLSRAFGCKPEEICGY